MASKPSGNPKMIVQYEWIFENVEKEPKTFASKMILFRGEKVFRVGLKNHVKSPVLFFMAINLNKIGMKVEGVMCGVQGSGIGPATMWRLAKKNIGDDENLQLFSSELIQQVTGKHTFVFRIHIEGSVPGYSYRLSDRLAKDQLWEAAKSRDLVDIEFVVKDKTFYAHKAILAARSRKFAAEFTKEQPAVLGAVGLHQIHISGVEPFTVEQFLHFVYTGEPMGTLANEELLKLADQYELPTLSSLCRVALNNIETTQMANLTSSLHSNSEIAFSFIVRPDKDTEIFFDRTTSTFRCDLSFTPFENGKSKCMMTYQNENIFSAYFTRGKVTNPTDEQIAFIKPVIHFLCSKHRKLGLKIEDVYCKQKIGHLFKMESKHLQKNAELLLHFTKQLESKSRYPTELSFEIKIVSTIGNYYYEIMDDAWIKHFWSAATNQKFTDVEIFVGTVKLMEAHRIILSARSPVLKALLSKISNAGKSIVTFGAEFDVETVKHFLNFLYTGSLETSNANKLLLKLATIYEVETLKNFCQLANHVPDVEELTNCLLHL